MGSWVKGRAGDWLVKAAPGLSGESISVARRDGRTSKIRLGREVWAGEGRALYTVAPKGPTLPQDAPSVPDSPKADPAPSVAPPVILSPVGPIVDAVSTPAPAPVPLYRPARRPVRRAPRTDYTSNDGSRMDF